jgi:cytidylate kinase
MSADPAEPSVAASPLPSLTTVTPNTPNASTLRELTAKYISNKGRLLICISGMSGAGKSYHSEKLAKTMQLGHLDQDAYFRPDDAMPLVELSDGSSPYPNWDCKEALDLDGMNSRISILAPAGLIFSGFACRDAWIDTPIDLQIHLDISVETCIQRRKERHVDPPQYAEIVPRELVYPFHIETRSHSRCDVVIDANEKSPETFRAIVAAVDSFLRVHDADS